MELPITCGPMQRLFYLELIMLGMISGCLGPKQGPTPEPRSADASEPVTEFAPIPPAEDGWAWIQLNTGEWLKGELLEIRDGTLEFDSDKLDELTFDIEDVSFVRSPRQHAVQLEGQRILRGTVLVQDGQLMVSGPGGGSAERGQLMSVVPAGGSLLSHWTGKVTIGYTSRSGNTTQTDFTTFVSTRRQSAQTRWDTSFNSAFSRSKGVETASNSRLSSNFDIFISKRKFVTPLAVTASTDKFTNIDLRLTPSAKVGYDLIDDNTLSWEIGGGPGWEYTRYDSVPAGTAGSTYFWAALLNTDLEWDVTPDVEVILSYDLTVPVPETHRYTHHLSSTLSLELSDWLDVDLNLVWDRVNKPLTNNDDVTPKPDDLKIYFGLGIEF